MMTEKEVRDFERVGSLAEANEIIHRKARAIEADDVCPECGGFENTHTDYGILAPCSRVTRRPSLIVSGWTVR